MNILVLGGGGMLGHKMFQSLLTQYPETTCTILGRLGEPPYNRIDLFNIGNVIENVDATDSKSLQKLLERNEPQFIVNCIGIVKQRPEASAFIPSIMLNSLLPHKLADVALKWGGKVIHFSTDCVFSGNRGEYTEGDQSDAEDLYGKSKYLGEVATENALTLRTSIIGRELSHFKSLLEWFLAQHDGTVCGFKNVIYSGVTTNYLSELVLRLIMEKPELSGLYQVTAPKISKHDLLYRLKNAFNIKLEIIPDDCEHSDRSMVGNKFWQSTGFQQPDWDILIHQLASDQTPYDKWREKNNV